MKWQEINLQSIWDDEMEWNDSDKTGRKFNDEVENEFWKRIAPTYVKENDLNRHTPLIAGKLKQILGPNHTILEIGPGTGNFSVLMAQYSKWVHGVDFSVDMIRELRERCDKEHIANISIEQGKWEEFQSKGKYDYVVSINSLYRIHCIKAGLLKMRNYGRRGFVIVRSLERPRFHQIYDQCQLPRRGCRDYQLMPIVLWGNGVEANVEFVKYQVIQEYADLKQVEQTMIHDIGDAVYSTYRETLRDHFLAEAQQVDSKYQYPVSCAAVFIYKCAE